MGDGSLGNLEILNDFKDKDSYAQQVQKLFHSFEQFIKDAQIKETPRKEVRRKLKRTLRKRAFARLSKIDDKTKLTSHKRRIDGGTESSLLITKLFES